MCVGPRRVGGQCMQWAGLVWTHPLPHPEEGGAWGQASARSGNLQSPCYQSGMNAVHVQTPNLYMLMILVQIKDMS